MFYLWSFLAARLISLFGIGGRSSFRLTPQARFQARYTPVQEVDLIGEIDASTTVAFEDGPKLLSFGAICGQFLGSCGLRGRHLAGPPSSGRQSHRTGSGNLEERWPCVKKGRDARALCALLTLNRVPKSLRQSIKLGAFGASPGDY
jgi:hypothetical protein